MGRRGKKKNNLVAFWESEGAREEKREREQSGEFRVMFRQQGTHLN